MSDARCRTHRDDHGAVSLSEFVIVQPRLRKIDDEDCGTHAMLSATAIDPYSKHMSGVVVLHMDFATLNELLTNGERLLRDGRSVDRVRDLAPNTEDAALAEVSS